MKKLMSAAVLTVLSTGLSFADEVVLQQQQGPFTSNKGRQILRKDLALEDSYIAGVDLNVSVSKSLAKVNSKEDLLYDSDSDDEKEEVTAQISRQNSKADLNALEAGVPTTKQKLSVWGSIKSGISRFFKAIGSCFGLR